MIPAKIASRRRRAILIARIAVAILALYHASFAVEILDQILSSSGNGTGLPIWIRGLAYVVFDYSLFINVVGYALLAYAMWPFRFDWPRPARWMSHACILYTAASANQAVLLATARIESVLHGNMPVLELHNAAARLNDSFGVAFWLGALLGLFVICISAVQLCWIRNKPGLFRWFLIATFSVQIGLLAFWGQLLYLFPIGLWILLEVGMILSSILFIFALVAIIKILPRLPLDLSDTGVCAGCGYSLEGIGDVPCPECGLDRNAIRNRIVALLEKTGNSQAVPTSRH